MSPLKIGVKGDMSTCAFKSLCIAFESFVRIMQINYCQGEITYKKLGSRINALLGNDYRLKMLQRILLATSKNLDASTMHIAEDRCVRWMTLGGEDHRENEIEEVTAGMVQAWVGHFVTSITLP